MKLFARQYERKERREYQKNKAGYLTNRCDFWGPLTFNHNATRLCKREHPAFVRCSANGNTHKTGIRHMFTNAFVTDGRTYG